MKPILVIGGINMDILGVPAQPFQLRDSVPGFVSLSPGGVGHNIARHLARMREEVELMTILGDDMLAQHLQQSCRDTGIGLRHTLSLPGASNTYMAVHDGQGDMLAAINSMALMDRLSAERILQALPPDGFTACVLDANLSAEALQAAAGHVRAPLMADPVSVAKGERLRAILPKLHAIKPNWLEAQALTGKDSPEEAAESLLALGLQQVFISLGGDGLYFAAADDQGFLRPAKRLDSPATGAGDAMTAGLALALKQGLSARQAAMLGMAQAADQLERNIRLQHREDEQA